MLVLRKIINYNSIFSCLISPLFNLVKEKNNNKGSGTTEKVIDLGFVSPVALIQFHLNRRKSQGEKKTHSPNCDTSLYSSISKVSPKSSCSWMTRNLP